MSPLIELHGVSKRIGAKRLLNNVSFQVRANQITTLIGQNGAGKTTLAKIILKLLNFDSGTLYLQPNLQLGYVPQKLDFDASLPITVEALLNILSRGRAFQSPAWDYCQKLLAVEPLKHKFINQISGGQLQKIIIIGSLVALPDVIVLDEPTQFLDVTSQQKFYVLLKELQTAFGMTIFMISHDLFAVMKNSDQVICLNQHVCCSGSSSDINQNAEFKAALSEIGFYSHHHDHQH